MMPTIIDVRVHTLFACLSHCTGARIHLCHGNNFVLNLKEKIKLLNNGAQVLLTDRWDSFCRGCAGIKGGCNEQQMQELDRFALRLINQKLGLQGPKALKMYELYIPTFQDILTVRKEFKENGLRDICSYKTSACTYLSGCVRRAEDNYLKVLFMPLAVPA